MVVSNKVVEVRHEKTGEVTTVGENVWKDWKSAKAGNNEVRQGYRLIRTLTLDAKTGKVIAEEKAPVATNRKAVTFVPPFLKPKEGEQAQAFTASTEPQPEQPASPAPPSQPQGRQDNLVAIPSVGIKVAQALTQAGYGTYKALSAATADQIGAVLDGMVPPMSPKKAQIPAWQKAAGEFVKAAEQPQE